MTRDDPMIAAKFRKQAIRRILALRKRAWSSPATQIDMLRYIAALLELRAATDMKEEYRT